MLTDRHGNRFDHRRSSYNYVNVAAQLRKAVRATNLSKCPLSNGPQYMEVVEADYRIIEQNTAVKAAISMPHTHTHIFVYASTSQSPTTRSEGLAG